MTPELKIFLSAIAVCALAFVVWLIRVKMDGRRLRARREAQELERRRAEDEERERLFAKPDDDTKTLPPGAMA